MSKKIYLIQDLGNYLKLFRHDNVKKNNQFGSLIIAHHHLLFVFTNHCKKVKENQIEGLTCFEGRQNYMLLF